MKYTPSASPPIAVPPPSFYVTLCPVRNLWFLKVRVLPEIDTMEVSVASKVTVNDCMSSNSLKLFVESPTTAGFPM